MTKTDQNQDREAFEAAAKEVGFNLLTERDGSYSTWGTIKARKLWDLAHERARAASPAPQVPDDAAEQLEHAGVIIGQADAMEARQERDEAAARADALQAEVERLREIVASFVAMVEDSMSGTTHPEVGRFVPGVTDLELRPDGSLKLSDARAALQHQEPKP